MGVDIHSKIQELFEENFHILVHVKLCSEVVKGGVTIVIRLKRLGAIAQQEFDDFESLFTQQAVEGCVAFEIWSVGETACFGNDFFKEFIEVFFTVQCSDVIPGPQLSTHMPAR